MTRAAIIVAHGQPSDPAPAEAEIAALATSVAAHLPGWDIRSSTLAAPGALDRAVAGLSAPLIFPFFMADGWFIRAALPDRLAKAGVSDATVLTPFGLLPQVKALAGDAAAAAAQRHGWSCAETVLVIAAHGSGRSPYPAQAAGATAEAIAATHGFAAIRIGFIEEPPYLADEAAHAGLRAICLPLFVARWGHTETDIPEALRKAEFSGVLLDPIGTLPEAPKLIAGAIAGSL